MKKGPAARVGSVAGFRVMHGSDGGLSRLAPSQPMLLLHLVLGVDHVVAAVLLGAAPGVGPGSAAWLAAGLGVEVLGHRLDGRLQLRRSRS